MHSPNWEGFKEVARWVALFLGSWLITETLKQISLVPEHFMLNVWVFHYSVPIQLGLNFALTFAGRWIDKALFIANKEKIDNKRVYTTEKPKGLLPF